MNCHSAESLILAERDGTLSEIQRTELARHLAECAACRQWQNELSAALAEFRADAGSVRVPDAAVEWRKLQARVHQPASTPVSHERRQAPLVWFTGPLAAAAAIALAFFIGRPTPASRDAATPTEISPFAGLAQAEFVDVAVEDATPIVYVDQQSGWLVVWADVTASNTHG